MLYHIIFKHIIYIYMYIYICIYIYIKCTVIHVLHVHDIHTHLYTYKNYHELLAIECERVCQRMRVTNITSAVRSVFGCGSAQHYPSLSHMVMGQNPGTRMAPKVIAALWMIIMIIPNVISIAFDPSQCRNESRQFTKPRLKPPVSYCVYDLMSSQVFDKIVILVL